MDHMHQNSCTGPDGNPPVSESESFRWTPAHIHPNFLSANSAIQEAVRAQRLLFEHKPFSGSNKKEKAALSGTVNKVMRLIHASQIPSYPQAQV